MRLMIVFFTCLAICLCTMPWAALGAGIVISEIMYNSPGLTDIEYFEVYNDSDAAIDVNGWTVLDSNDEHLKIPLVGVIAPRDVLVVAGDLTLFNLRYPGVTNVNPNAFEPNWKLANEGDSVRVFNAIDQLVDLVAYDEIPPWPFEADGSGPSLELIDPALDNNLPTSWQAGPDGGNPGSYTAPSAVERKTWGAIKALYQLD